MVNKPLQSSVVPSAWQQQHQLAQTKMPPETRHPFVTLKAAATLDGKIANAQGESQWITAPSTRQHAHRLRAEHDAILVGVNTVLRDDPQLNVRLDPASQSPSPARFFPPGRIVLDSQAKSPATARCWANDGALRLLVCGSHAPASRLASISEQGVEVVQHACAQPSLTQLLPVLHRHWHIRTLLVEGGGLVHAGFIAQGLADALVLYLAGKLMGQSAAPAWCANLPTNPPAEACANNPMAGLPSLNQLQAFTLQEDVWLLGRFSC